MWTVDRTNAPRARASGGPGDTPAGLADLVGLQADEESAWFRRADGAGPEKASGEVPNTILFLWAGDLGWLGKLAVGWGREAASARSLGFHTVELDFRGGLSDFEVLERVAGCSQNAELHGLVVTGHGSPQGFGTGGVTRFYHPKRWYFGYDELGEALAYRLALVVLNACLSGYSRHDTRIRTARTFLTSAVDPNFTLTAGGRDLVASSPAARFYGHAGILYPVLQGGRLRRMVRPGDQGTVAGSS